jgi:hypothetical protein
MRKKSKWQQRLEEIQKNLKTRRPGDDMEPQVNLHKMSYMTPPPGRDWIAIEDEKPPYYSPIDMWDGKELYEDWHRLSNGDHDYYASLWDNKIKRHITHWAKRPGMKYHKYDPLTIDNISQPSEEPKTISVDDVQQVINQLSEKLVPADDADYDDWGYNEGLTLAIKLLKRLTPNV